MAEGFGQYVGSTARVRRLREAVGRLDIKDPEDIMILIMDIFTEKVWIPEVGKFYTFVYNPKTPDIEYDQHPLIACTEIYKWGFKAINFHWRESRNYTWQELAGQLHVVKYEELDELLSLQYAKFRLNK
ncbi:MAG: hypothetical protein EBU90_08755 [Proteobacteria bacterium]|nr:hypothetical protein [Pseudomonadota bacterium]